MKKIQFKFSIVFILLFLFGCSLNEPDKGNLPSWTIRVEVPLLETEVTLEEFLEDSLIHKIPVDENGDSIFVFEKSIDIDTVTVGDQLEIDNITESFSQSVEDVTVEDTQVEEKVGFDPVGVSPIEKVISSVVGTITLNDIDIVGTDPYTFSSIYPDLGSIPNDTTVNIPAFNLEPVANSFTFDDFTNAVFTGGTLNLTIQNNLVIPLGDTQIDLQDIDGNPISGGTVSIPGPIQPGESGSGQLSLVGVTLPGDLKVQVTGNSPGQDNLTIDEDARNSSFTVLISGSDLEVESATAKLPVQTINEAGSITLSESDSNKVEEARILDGRLVIEIDNYMGISSVLNIVIPSIQTPSGYIFQTTINVDANQTGIQDVTWLTDYSLIMTLGDQSVSYQYAVNTIDTGDDLVTITSEDSIQISIGLDGGSVNNDITFSYFQGLITPQNLGFDGSISMESESDILEADLGSGQIVITVNNQVNQTVGGAPSAIITVEELLNNQDQPLEITIEQIAGEMLPETIDLSDYRIVMPLEDQNLHYTADVSTTYGEVGEYSLTDSITVEIQVAGLTFTEVRGYFTQDAIVDSSTIEMENETKVEEAVMKSGDLGLTIRNHIGIIAIADITINEFSKNGEIINIEIPINSSSTPQDTIIHLDGYVISLPIGDQTIHYTSKISIPSDSAMTLTFGDSIQVDVNIVDISFESITGIIDTVEVGIEPVEQSIDALPEEMNGINFEHVDMYLDFDTNIGIPVLLNLTITASNEAGDIEESSVTNWDITDSTHVVMPDAERLINIKPDNIIAEGQATILGEGTVATDQFIDGTFTVSAPLEFEITDSAKIELDPEKVEMEIQDELEAAVLYMDIDNQFEFGSSISVLTADFITQFDDGSADTLFTLNIEPDTVKTDSIDLNDEKLDLFRRDSLYVKSDVQLLGTQDEPSKFLSTDSLKILLYGAFQYLVDPAAQDEE